MKYSLIKITRLSLLAILLAVIPAVSHAQPTNTAITTNALTALPRPLPFRGNVAKVDTNAMTVTVGTLVLSVTPTTRFAKLNHAAGFSDIHVGDFVNGYYRKGPDGKLDLFMIRSVPRSRLVREKAADSTAPGVPSAPATPGTNQ
jgi:hypothetical protein